MVRKNAKTDGQKRSETDSPKSAQMSEKMRKRSKMNINIFGRPGTGVGNFSCLQGLVHTTFAEMTPLPCEIAKLLVLRNPEKFKVAQNQGNLNGGLANWGLAQKVPIRPQRPFSEQLLRFPRGCEVLRNSSLGIRFLEVSKRQIRLSKVGLRNPI